MDETEAKEETGRGTGRAMDEQLVQQLACPACRGGLSFSGTELTCAECGRGYPVVDGIPVLVADSKPAS